MSLDETTKRQLVEARETIIAQLAQLTFRVTSQGHGWRRRGPQESNDIYDALKNELREINELLGLDADDEV